jgi:hypothetical protein
MLDKLNIITLEAICIGVSIDARLFDFGEDEPVWLPISQHQWNSREGEVWISEKLAIEKGLV